MMRFYGMSVSEFEDLDASRAESLWECITIIEAQELLAKSQIHFWPQLKHEDYLKQHKQIHKLAYPGVHEKKTFITPEQLQARLARG